MLFLKKMIWKLNSSSPNNRLWTFHKTPFSRDGANFTCHDYEAIDSNVAEELIENLRNISTSLTGKKYGDYKIELCDDFSYTDPVDGSVTEKQGIRILFDDESRIVFRLSGTGTEGATLRVYIERYVKDVTLHNMPTQTALSDLIDIADSIAEIKTRCQRDEPDIIT